MENYVFDAFVYWNIEDFHITDVIYDYQWKPNNKDRIILVTKIIEKLKNDE